MKRGEKSTQFLKGVCSWSVLVHEKKKCENLKNIHVSLTFFRTSFNLYRSTQCLWPEPQIDSFITLG